MKLNFDCKEINTSSAVLSRLIFTYIWCVENLSVPFWKWTDSQYYL